MIERGSAWPSGSPSRVESEPAATLRHTTSSGMISTSLISCSRRFSRRMKWFCTPMRVQPRHHELADAVVQHALAFQHRLLLGVEGGRVVLEILDQRAGLGTLVEDLGLPLVDLLAAGGRHFGRAPTGEALNGTTSARTNPCAVPIQSPRTYRTTARVSEWASRRKPSRRKPGGRNGFDRRRQTFPGRAAEVIGTQIWSD